jgi:hypothetical protein
MPTALSHYASFLLFLFTFFPHLLLSFILSFLTNNNLRFHFKFVDSPIHNLDANVRTPNYNGLVIFCYSLLH